MGHRIIKEARRLGEVENRRKRGNKRETKGPEHPKT
jgi:hypothetical protein